MENNIRMAEVALRIAVESGRVSDQPDERQMLAIVGVGQGIVAVAKALGAVGAMMYLRHVEEVRGGKPSDDAGIAKLERLVQKGLGL